ncbi:MAG: hypothetical protein ABFC87_00675 [Fervidobacterium sp.]
MRRSLIFISLLLLNIVMIFTLDSCILFNSAPVWKDLPLQIVPLGQTLNIDISQYVSDRNDQYISFKIVSGVGEIIDTSYVYTPSQAELNGNPTREMEVIIRAMDRMGAYADKVLKIIIVRSPLVSKIPDSYCIAGQELTIDISEYFELNTDEILSILSGPGLLNGQTYTLTPISTGTYTITLGVYNGSLLTALQQFNIYVLEHTFQINVSEYNSGGSIEGVKVAAYDRNGNLAETKLTDSSGKVYFDQQTYSKFILTKIDHAITTIELKGDTGPLSIDATLRPFVFTQPTTNDIAVQVGLYDGSSKTLESDESGRYTLFDDQEITVMASAASIAFPISHMYIKIGGVPGAEYLSSPRFYEEGNTIQGQVQLSGFSGLTMLYVDAYDNNDNRYLCIIPLSIQNSKQNASKPYIVEQNSNYSVRSCTVNDGTEYYSHSSYQSNQTSTPLGAPKGMNLYVELYWKAWEDSAQKRYTNPPASYRIYRSFDGINYYHIATVPPELSFYRDSSSQLECGKRVWYAVSSVYSFGESPKTVLGSAVPLPMVYMTAVTPCDNATNVSTKPTFSWYFTGLESYSTNITYTYDLWLYDATVDEKLFYASKDGLTTFSTTEEHVTIDFPSYRWMKYGAASYITTLQIAHPYEWAPELLIGEWLDEKNNSLSVAINCNYNSEYLAPTIPPEKYYLFVTGNN